MIKWICPWFESRRGDVIYSCGQFPNVPLMGPRGCITYTPAIVLKQLGWTQKQPREEQLGGYCFSYKDDDDDTKALTREIKKAWGDVRMAGRSELGRPLLINTAEYIAWREARRMSDNTPEVATRRNDSPHSTPQMVEQLELMRAQMRFLDERKEKAELEVVIAQSKCEKMAKEIERLKDECADLGETSRVSRGKQKMSENLLGRIQELEEEVQFRAKENHELKQKICQRDREKEKLKMEVNRERQAKEALERGKAIQSQRQKVLKQKVEELTVLLTQTKIDCNQGWASSHQYHELFIEAANEGRWWRSQALNQGAEVEDWKKKYKNVIDELNRHVPNFVHHFEKANEHVRVNPMLRLPSEVDEFMELCKDLTRGLKRKKRRMLM